MYSVSIISDEHLYKLKLLFRKTLPQNQFFFLLIFILKYLPIIAFTHAIIPNYPPTSRIFTLSTIIQGITSMKPNNTLDYYLLCKIIYFFLFILLLLTIYLFYKIFFLSRNTDNKVYDIPNNKLNIPHHIKQLFHFICFFYFAVIILYQHIIEILCYAIFILIFKKSSTSFTLNNNNAQSYLNSNYNYIVVSINILFILLLITAMYFFIILSSNRTISKTYGFQSSMSPICLYTSIILFSTQGFYSFVLFFKDDTYRDRNSIIMCYVFVMILFINAVSNFKQTNYSSHCLIDYFLRFINNFCFVSGVLELIIYHCYPSEQKRTQSFYIVKLILDVVNSVMITWLFTLIQKNIAIKSVIKNFFNSNRTFQFENLFNFYLLLKNCDTFHKKYFFIFELLQLHRQYCTEEKCECRNHDKFFNSNFEIEKFRNAINVFLSISEDKITSAIINFSKEKNKTTMTKLFTLHIDYLFSIKQNVPLTLYLSQYYLIQHKKELSFNDAYLIYEINYILIKRYRNANRELSFIKKNMIIEKIQKIIMQLCDNMEKIFYYKSLKNANNKLAFKCEDILYPLINYVKQNQHLRNMINTYSTQDIFEHSIELKYTIIYFLKLFSIKLPKKTFKKLYHGKCRFPSYAEIERNNDENNVDKSNYMVLFLRNDNRFIIKYLSLEIAEMLEYNKNELLNTDFNEMVIPNAIQHYHCIYMKQFVLSGLTVFKQNTFLVNKSLHLILVNVKCIVLPTKNTLYSLFIKIKQSKSYVYSQSHLLLDMSYQLWGMSKSFENNFIFTLDMLKMIKFNFCDFFGINKETINSYFLELRQIAKIITTKQEEGDVIDHNKLSKIIALPTVRKEELRFYRFIDFDMFKNEKMKRKKQKKDRLIKLQIVPKRKIINSVIRLRKSIDEMGLERDWKVRLNELYMKLTSHCAKNETVIMQSDNPNINTNSSSNNNIYNGLCEYGNFYIKFHLKQIGDILYFVTTISDILDEEHLNNNNNNAKRTPVNKKYYSYYTKNIDKERKNMKYNLNFLASEDSDMNNNNNTSSLLNYKNFVKSANLIIPIKHQKKKTFKRSNKATIHTNTNTNTPTPSPTPTLHSESIGSIHQNSFNHNNTYNSINNTHNDSNNIFINSRYNSEIGLVSRQNSFDISTTSASLNNNSSSNSIFNKNKYIFSFSANSQSSNNYLSLLTINNKEKQIIIFRGIIFLFLIIVFILNIVNIILNNISTKYSLNLFFINAYTFLLTNDIYYGVLACIDTCLVKDQIQNGNLSKLYSKTQQSSFDLIEHFHSLTSYMNEIIYKSEISEIYNVFHKEIEFKYILGNWKESIKKSNLFEEIYYIHYHLKIFNQHYEECRMKQVFFNQQFKDLVHSSSMEFLPTNEEAFIYYICANVVSGVSTMLEELMKTVNSILHNNNKKDNINSLILNIAIVISTLILYCSSIFIIQSSRFLFKGKMIYLFSKQENEEIFYEDIRKFKKLLNCFSIKECDEYTHYKIYLNSPNIPLSPHNRSLSTNNQNSSKISSLQKSTTKQLHSKKQKRMQKQTQGEYKLKIIRLPKNRQNTLKRSYSSHVNDELQNKLILTNKNFRDRAEPKFAFCSLITISITFLLILAIELASICVSLNAHIVLTTENYLATSFLSRGPKLNELFLYSIISVIMNNVEYISKDVSLYDVYILSNHYNVKFDFDSNSIFKSFGKSNYAYLYYQLYIIRTNINLFVNDNKMKKYLVNTVKKEFLFERKENFCLYASLDYLQYYIKDSSLAEGNEFIKEWNGLVKECRELGNGINLSGYQAALDLMLELLSSHYYSFKVSDEGDNGDNVVDKQSAFLESEDMFIIEENILNVLRTLHIADSYSAIEDVEKSYHDSHNVKIIFLVVSICFCSGIIMIMILVIIIKFSFYINIISEIGRVFEKAIQNYN